MIRLNLADLPLPVASFAEKAVLQLRKKGVGEDETVRLVRESMEEYQTALRRSAACPCDSCRERRDEGETRHEPAPEPAAAPPVLDPKALWFLLGSAPRPWLLGVLLFAILCSAGVVAVLALILGLVFGG